MRDTAFVFFLAAVLCVSIGMGWGIQMAISQDHLLAPAHAHLNLVGWATLGLFGLYYRLTPTANATILARIHAGVAIVGIAFMVPGIAMAVAGGTTAVAAFGSILSALSMAIFLYTVTRHGLGSRPVA